MLWLVEIRLNKKGFKRPKEETWPLREQLSAGQESVPNVLGLDSKSFKEKEKTDRRCGMILNHQIKREMETKHARFC